MKVKYRHISDPNTKKVYDVIKAWKGLPNFITGKPKSLEQFEQEELNRFSEDKKKGTILEYEVIKES